MRYYNPLYFQPYELLPKDVFTKYGAAGLMAMDPRILWTLDQVRKSAGKPITVNNWQAGGPFSQRGFRNDPATGAPLSQHRFGRAVDFDIAGITAAEFRDEVKKGKFIQELTYITRIEDGVNWIHLDCAAVPGTEIVFIKP